MHRKAPPCREYMSKLPVEIEHGAKLTEAERVMSEAGIRHVPVMNGYRLFGVLSEHDLSNARLSLGVAYRDAIAEDFCMRDVLTIAPMAPITDAARAIMERQVGSALVIEGDLVIGIITRSDLLRALCDAYH